jgi:hypothetical protein
MPPAADSGATGATAPAAPAADEDADIAPAPPTLAALPLPLALHILSLLPVHARLLCRGVCVRWRALASSPELYATVSLTRGLGAVPPRLATDALLAAAAAAAAGQLRALDVRGCSGVSYEGVLAALAANPRSVTALLVGMRQMTLFAELADAWSGEQCERALRAAGPQLARLSVRTAGGGSVDGARRILRGDAPLSPLAARCLHVPAGGAPEGALLGLAADLRACTRIQQLYLCPASLSGAALDAIVDAALAARLVGVHLAHVTFAGAAPLRALTRLVAGGVARLTVSRSELPGDALAEDVAAFADALRASTRLTGLNLRTFFAHNEGAAGAVLGALEGHASLRKLDASARRPCASFGGALARLVAADAPALRSLTASHCRLGDAGLAPLCEALKGNTHLRELRVSGNHCSAAFVRDALLPAVRANASLRVLEAGSAAAAAEACVNARGRAAAASGADADAGGGV